MKRTIVYLLTAIMLLSLIAGCSDKKSTEVETPTAAPNAQATATVEPAVTTEPTATPEPSLDDLVALSVANRPAEPCDQATHDAAYDDETMEFLNFDCDYNGYEDWMEDWTLEGKQNYQYGEFYWYDDADGDGLLNVFDEDWAGYKFLPFGADELPKSMADVPERTWETADYSAQLEVLVAAMNAYRAENGMPEDVTVAESKYANNFMNVMFVRYSTENFLKNGKKPLAYGKDGFVSLTEMYETNQYTCTMQYYAIEEDAFMEQASADEFDWDTFLKLVTEMPNFDKVMTYQYPIIVSFEVTAIPYTYDGESYVVIELMRTVVDKSLSHPMVEPFYCELCGKIGNTHIREIHAGSADTFPYRIYSFYSAEGMPRLCRECSYQYEGIDPEELADTWGK